MDDTYTVPTVLLVLPVLLIVGALWMWGFFYVWRRWVERPLTRWVARRFGLTDEQIEAIETESK